MEVPRPKAHFSSKDNWGYDLKILSNGNCLTIAADDIDKNLNPILFNVAKSYNTIQTAFLNTNDNYKRGLILNSPILDDDRKLTPNFFDQNPPMNIKKVAKLTFCDIFREGHMRSLWEINNEFDIGLNLITYMRLGQSCVNFYNSLKANRITNGVTLSLSNFLCNFKKGSKPIRKILSNAKLGGIKIDERRHVVSFFRITDITNPDPAYVKKLNEGVNIHSYPNKLREFIFKFNSNTLGINTRIANFVEGASRACTFCIINRLLPAHEESFLHIFFFCNTTSKWLSEFESRYYPELNLTGINDRKHFWFLHFGTNVGWNFFMSSSIWFFKFLIWEAKLKKLSPSFNSLQIDLFIMLSNLLKISSQAKDDFKKINFNLCRLLGNGGRL